MILPPGDAPAENRKTRRGVMIRAELTEKILDIKREKGMLITGAPLGEVKPTKPQAAKAAELFGLSNSEQARTASIRGPRRRKRRGGA
jgi:hypothetical protein